MGTQYVVAWAAVISAFSALVGIIVTAWLARRSLIAPMRLEWITMLRNHLTELTAEATTINREYRFLGVEKLPRDVRRNLVLLEHKIRLLLNPDEAPHQQLLSAAQEVLKGSLLKNQDEFEQALDRVMDLAQIVFHKEWKRVKNME